MGEVTSEARRAITPGNAVALFVDHQDGWFGGIHDPEGTRNRIEALARSCRLLGVPAVLTTNQADGTNRPMIDVLADVFAGHEVLDRTVINAWDEPRVRDAIVDTGRDHLIVTGTGFELCATLPALGAAADGWKTYAVVDASGRYDPSPVTEMMRLTNAGVALANTTPLVLEMMADNAHPKVGEVYGILFG